MQYQKLFLDGKIYTTKSYAESDTQFKGNNSLVNLVNDEGTYEVLDIVYVDFSCQCGFHGQCKLMRSDARPLS